MSVDPKEWTKAAADLAASTGWSFKEANEALLQTAGLGVLLDEAASLIMAVDTVGPERRVVIPEGWFDQTNALLARIRRVET